jgi:predicted metal-dependent hydrolase
MKAFKLVYNIKMIFESNINFKINKSKRFKRMRLVVNRDMSVVANAPYGLPNVLIYNFLKAKTPWVIKSLNYFKKFQNLPVVKTSRKDYLENKLTALSLAKNKVLYWNQFYKFNVGRVGIKNQKTRWGSCSRKGNLNFNYKIVHLSEKLVDYLVVHELCHLKEFNHSKNFWQLVGQTIPNYKILRTELKKYQ